MITTCTLCGDEDRDLTHLALYAFGSEGIYVCLRCRMHLTQQARNIRELASRIAIRAHKEAAGIRNRPESGGNLKTLR